MTNKTSLDALDDSIFHSNLSLLDNDVPEVKSRLSIAASELVLLDAQISEIKTKLQSLTRQRDQQALRVHRYQGVLSAFRTLPAEVVRELLIQCVHSSGPMGLLPHPTDTRLVLTQVCSLWRTIVCSTPDLWCDYEIRAMKSLDDTRGRMKDLMTACFGRAKTLPLNLSVKPFTTPSEVLPVYLIADVVKPWAERYGKLDLIFPRKEVWYWATYETETRIKLPILTEFKLQEAKDDGEMPDEYFDDEEFSLVGWSDLPVECPSLTSLSLSIGLDIQHVGFPWENMTTIHIKFDYVFSQQCYDLWGRCPLLEDFTAELAPEETTSQPLDQPINLPELRKLSFTASSAFSCRHILHSLEAPKLRDISISLTDSFFDSDVLELKAISGIDDKLRELKVQQGMQLEEPILNELGQGLFASLERLSLNFFDPNFEDEHYGPDSKYFELVMKMLVDRQKYTEAQRSTESGKRIVPLASVEVAYQPYHWDGKKDEQVKRTLDSGVPLRMTWDAAYLE
ncbi:hypothetical protein BDN72DRAFT_163267 [Pluteus cervinus]|uniref:Uncharacterized protein n=1 Tax=Pluteus cervinus TaxID=181527 RepID=A0ACD3AJU1_9AGAR|nr:hypothetical protein BDN72DRAFT_163267 [Pluteus cervinus]